MKTEFGIFGEEEFDALAGPDDGAVIPSREKLADLREMLPGQLAGQEHRALPGDNAGLQAAIGTHMADRNPEMLRRGPDDFRQGDFRERGIRLQEFADVRDVDAGAGLAGEGLQPNDQPDQFAGRPGSLACE